jgi:hypothetical protein
MQQLFDEFKEYIITGVISLITGLIAYFQGKRTKEAETKQAEGAALETIQLVYDKFVSDTKARLDEQHLEITQMKEERVKEKEERTKEVKSLREKIKTLVDHVSQLQIDLDDCRKNIE